MEISTSSPAASPGRLPMVIECDTCVSQHSEICSDCLVTFVCDREPSDAVVIDVAELRAMRMLGDGGLVPRLRHVRRAG